MIKIKLTHTRLTIETNNLHHLNAVLDYEEIPHKSYNDMVVISGTCNVLFNAIEVLSTYYPIEIV